MIIDHFRFSERLTYPIVNSVVSLYPLCSSPAPSGIKAPPVTCVSSRPTMSTTSFLLLSLLCLVVTHSDAYLGWRTDGSALVAKSFIVVFRNAIENEYAEELEEIIADDIFFIDCSMKYNKSNVPKVFCR